MLMRSPAEYLRVSTDERGAVLVISLVVMLTLFVIASYAIDTGIWFVHHRHLQTQADAAALAGAQNFQYPCTPGGTMDQAVATTVHRYDGTTVSSGGYNTQVPVTPTPSTTYSSTAHNLISQINQADFVDQSQPNDSGLSGSPCADGVIDVKLSETNLPSFFPPLFSPPHITAQARVSILQATSNVGAEPFAEPLPTPNTMTATLVDESNNDAAIAGPITLTPSGEHTTWTANAVPVTFTDPNKEGPIAIGMRIAMSGGTSATCGTAGVTCYQNDGSNRGVTLTRAWINSGTPGQPSGSSPVAPQTNDVTVIPGSSNPCPAGPSGTFSNFVSSSSSCTVQVTAGNVVFATGSGAPEISCSDAALKLNGVAIPCPTGSPLNGQTWTSGNVTVTPNSGFTTLTLTWQLTAGKIPLGASGGDRTGSCTSSKPCTGTLATQRINSGGYDSQSVEADGNSSGPILGAALTDSSGNEIMSVARGTAENVNITVNVLGFQNSQTIPSAPVELSFGGNQENAALSCGEEEKESAGSPKFEKHLAEGCPEPFATTTQPNPPICAEQPPGYPVCVKENPGNGKLEKDLDKGMNQRINEGRNTCVNPNHWASPNSVGEVLAQSPRDPRLITTIITDYGALNNGTKEIPVRIFATFYVTGWAGDPCIGEPNGTSSNGLAYTTDESPTGENPRGVLLGHFVKYVNSVSTGTGSGACSQTAFGNCIAVLTR
jgi:Putative Flp pilus-assembly TadE/G-like